VSRFVFLLEEPSMEAALDDLLRREIPPERYVLIAHEGKRDLDASIPRKLRAWREPGMRFVVVRDSHSEECKRLKARLKQLCARARRPDTLVRIVCRELESWFLGDLQAVADAFGQPRILRHIKRRAFQDPDSLTNACEELLKLVPGYQKRGGARAIAPRMLPERNRSHSFGVFWESVCDLAAASGRIP
jgi:hypothetical protein